MENQTRRGSTLFDLSAEMQELQYELGSFVGDVTDSEQEKRIDELLARAEETGDLVNKKLDGYVAIMTEIEGRAALRDKESKRLGELAKKDYARAGWLLSRLFKFFDVQKIRTRETDLHTITLADVGGLLKLEVDDGLDVEKLPAEFVTVVPEQVIPESKIVNGAAIREFLGKEGNSLTYARLLPRKKKLNIK